MMAQTLMQAQSRGPNDEPWSEWLGAAYIVLEGSKYPSTWRMLGLDPNTSIRARMRITEPDDPYSLGGPAWGSEMQFEVDVMRRNGETAGHALSSSLTRDATGTPILCPTPIDAHGNIFADNTGARYCVRAQAVPEPGIYFDTVESTPEQTQQTGSGRMQIAGLLASSDTRQPRITFRCEAPASNAREIGTMPDLIMQIWPSTPPGSLGKTPYTVYGGENIVREIRRVNERARARRPWRRDAAFKVTTMLHRSLETLHRSVDGEHAQREPRDLLTERDIDVIATRLGSLEPFKARQSVRSLANQRLTTASDTLRMALRRGLGEALVNLLEAETTEAAPTLRIAPTPGDAQDVSREIARALNTRLFKRCIERSLSEWRSTARTMQIPIGSSDIAVTTTASTVLLRAHHLDHHTDQKLADTELCAPHMAAFFFDPRGVAHSGSQTGRAAPCVQNARVVPRDGSNFTRDLAIELVDARTETARTVALHDLAGEALYLGDPREGIDPDNIVVDGYPAPDAPIRWYLPNPEEALAEPVANQLPLLGYTAIARAAMAVRMGMQTVGDGNETTPIIATRNTTDPGPRAPSKRLRTALVSGMPPLFEDAVMMSESAARRIGLDIYQTFTFERHRAEDGLCEYVGASAASFLDARRDIPELTQEAYDKLDMNGLVRLGETVEYPDIIQLRRRQLDDGRDRYEAVHAPPHGRHKVTEVDDGTGNNPRESWSDEIDMTLDELLGPSYASRGRQTVRVHLKETTTVSTTHKITLPDGTKGLVQVVPDASMPCDAEGNAFDVAINDRSVAARKAPSGLMQAQLGHLVRTRGRELLSTLETIAAHGARATTWGEREASIARTLHATRPGDDTPRPLTQHLGLDDTRPPDGATARVAAEKLEALGAPSSDAGRLCIVLPPGATPTQIAAVKTGLDYVDDEERTVRYADRTAFERGEPLASPATAGTLDLWVLKHLGRTSARYEGLDDETSINQTTGQPTNTRRLGRMEYDALRAGWCITSAIEMMALSDQLARKEAIEAAARGEVAETDPQALPTPIARRTLSQWFACAGLTQDEDGTLRPMSDIERRANAYMTLDADALEPPHDTEGIANPRGLAAPPPEKRWRFAVIELPELVLNPIALEPGPNGQTPIVPTALGMSAQELREHLAKTPGAAQDVRQELAALDTMIQFEPDRAMEWARGNPDREDRHTIDQRVKLVETLIENPTHMLSSWMMGTVAIPDPRLRGYPNGKPSVTGTDRTTERAQRLIRACLRMERGLSWQQARAELTRAVTDIVRGTTVEHIAGKHNPVARTVRGMNTPHSAAGPILPGNPAEQPPHVISVPAAAAIALAGHWAKAALVNSAGMTPQRADDTLKSLGRRGRRSGSMSADEGLALEVLRRVTALHPMLIGRSPALHHHSTEAAEGVIRIDSEDTSIRVHPLGCEGKNADFDGDQVGLFPCMGPAAAQEARRYLGANAQIKDSAGDGLHGLPRQDAMEGLIHHLNTATPHPRAAIETIGQDDPLLQATLERVFDALPSTRRTHWETPGARIDAEHLEHLITAMPTDTAPVAAMTPLLVGKLWETGFEAMRHNPDAHPSLTDYEALAQIFADARGKGLIDGVDPNGLQPLGVDAAPEDRKTFKEDAVERFETVVQWVNDMGKHPEALLELAQGDRKLAERAQRTLKLAQGGGRVKAFAIAQMCCERGAHQTLDGICQGTYEMNATVRGTSPADALRSRLIGWGLIVSNEAQVAKAGYLSQVLVNAVDGLHTTVIRTDCGGSPTRRQLRTTTLRTKSGQPDPKRIAQWVGTRYAGSKPITIANTTLQPGEPLNAHTLRTLAKHRGRTLAVDLTESVSTLNLADPDKRNALVGTTCIDTVQAPHATIRKGDTLGANDLEMLAQTQPPKWFTVDRARLEPATPMLEGAVLAREIRTPGGLPIKEGTALTSAHIERLAGERIKVAVRDATTCTLDEGVCATCVGQLRSTGKLPEIGAQIGIRGATAIGERIVQADLGRFHGDGVARRTRSGKRPPSEALMEALSNRPGRSNQNEPIDLGDPRRGALADKASTAWDESGATGRRRAMYEGLCTIVPSIERMDPSLIRVIAGVLAGGPDNERDTVSLEVAASRGNTLGHIASGTNPKPPARALGQVGMTLVSPIEQYTKIREAREASEEWRTNDAHRAAARNDIKALQRIAADDITAIHAVDADGWTGLRYAHSETAVRVFLEAGVSPTERAQRDPHGFNALELMTVRPMAPARGRTAQEERRATLKRMMATVKGAEATRIIAQDPLIGHILRANTSHAKTAARSH